MQPRIGQGKRFRRCSVVRQAVRHGEHRRRPADSDGRQTHRTDEVAWFPITGGGFFAGLCKTLPSYWLVKAGQLGYGVSTDPWGTRGWVTIAAWALAGTAFALWAYRRDTGRA